MEKKRSTVLTPETQWILAGILTPEGQRILAGGETLRHLHKSVSPLFATMIFRP